MNGKHIALMVVFLLSGCLNGPGFLSQDKAAQKTDKSTRPLASVIALPTAAVPASNQPVVLQDDGAVVTAKVSKASTSAQLVQASGGSAISSSSVSFPPGALAIDTEVSVEEGESIVGGGLADELGLETDNFISTAGAAVIVNSSTPIDAAVPFTVSVALGEGLGLVELDRARVFIAFRVFVAAENRYVVGAIPPSELTFLPDGNVSFAIQFFGVYQPALSDRALEKRIVATTELQTAVTRATTTRAEAVTTWSTPSIKFDERSRTLYCSASASTPVQYCSVAFGSDRIRAQYRVPTRTETSGSTMVPPDKVVRTAFCRVECRDALERITASAWSTESVAIPLGSDSATTPDGEAPGTAVEPSDGGAKLLHLSVAPGSTLDPRARGIDMIFDRKLEVASVNTGTVPFLASSATVALLDLTTGEAIPSTVVVEGDRLRVDFNRDLRVDSAYRIAISSGLRDGRFATSQAQSMMFRTSPAQWSAATPGLIVGGENLQHFLSNARGDVVLLKRHSFGMTAKRFGADGGVWTSLLDPTMDQVAVAPGESVAAMGANRDIVFAWSKDVDPTSRFCVFVRRWKYDAATNTGTWQPTTLARSGLLAKPYLVSVSINEAGDAVVIGTKGISSPYLIFDNRVTRDGMLKYDPDLEAKTPYVDLPTTVKVVTNNNGDHVVTYNYGSNWKALYGTYLPNGATPGLKWPLSPLDLVVGSALIGVMQATLDDQGNGVVAWTRQPAAGDPSVEMRTIRFPAGGGPRAWSAPSLIYQGAGAELLGIGKLGVDRFDIVFKDPPPAGTTGDPSVRLSRVSAGVVGGNLLWFQNARPAAFFTTNERYFMATNDGSGQFGVASVDANGAFSPAMIASLDGAVFDPTTLVRMAVSEGGGMLMLTVDGTIKGAKAVRFGPDPSNGGRLKPASSIIDALGGLAAMPKLDASITPTGEALLFVEAYSASVSFDFRLPVLP